MSENTVCKFGQLTLDGKFYEKCFCALCAKKMRRYVWRFGDREGWLEETSIVSVKLALDSILPSGSIVEIVPESRIIKYTTK